MAFHDVQFPTNLSLGATGGPERRTEIVTLANGHEERNTPWAHSRRRYDAGMAMSSLDDLERVIAFYEARQGQMHGFRWKDWADYRSARASEDLSPFDQLIAVGDDETKVFPLLKVYRSGDQSYARPITKPVFGTVQIAVGETPQVEGIDYSVDYATGLITFETAPDSQGEITAGYEFDVPVRFDTNTIQVSVSAFKAGQVPSIPVVEVRV
ncbi:MAG: phage distal tail protein, Rcc01695 family [Shimia sp.]